MRSTQFGTSRATRQMKTRTARREQRLEAQADAEEAQELNSFFDFEDDDEDDPVNVIVLKDNGRLTPEGIQELALSREREEDDFEAFIRSCPPNTW